MIRLVLMAALLLVAVAVFREWRRRDGRSRREVRVRELRGAFLHGRRPDPPQRSAALTQHSWGRLSFRLPTPWSQERHGDVLVFRVGAGGDAPLRVLRPSEPGPADPTSSSGEVLADGSELLRWLGITQQAERVQYGWRRRSANGGQAVTFLFELVLEEAGEAFRQADVTTIDRAVREAHFES